MLTASSSLPPAATFRETVADWLRDFQQRLCAQLEAADGVATFQSDNWQHGSGGGGLSRVIQGGRVLEKGGVNFSAVWGEMSEQAARVLLMPNPNYFATGVSVVQHPRSPMVPIAHMNVRYFEAGNGEAWFGGGIDLTPIYVDESQARWFHEQLKAVCDAHNPAYYPRFRQWADDYFFLPHRQETRGVGGIFFDRLTVGKDGTREELFAFIQAVGNVFGPTYTELMRQNQDRPFGERQVQWHMLRRARYAEFNLAFDRGTRFGLETGGRTESILMSLPPRCEWHYDQRPEPGSPEATTQAWLRKGVQWLENPS
ncbi:oxygen-dependent coproporphyrinogen oxidase [Hymenobacter lucidus]|uniref:coproporphyrinogen oxidase n=1 Tax=Hymenobacter lucidus TaxID=2880930 RepID=A0ABS8AXS5_9BACT|nr:oxygen-dependent coproporphyrinogen oxidase [Hymenobacter lucidus]MCB2410584.1 oxygen-dependent coproporphyrinogen oxidase [Hymenobacter lucidus]